MKGLLWKDLYVAAKYCRAYLLLVGAFLVFSAFSGENLFVIFYPCILASMVPMNLLAYDAQFKWEQYAGTLPYTREQLVSAKYLIGLFTAGAVLVLTGIAQAVRLSLGGGFRLGEFGNLMAVMFILSLIAPSISLPLMYRFGVEKGRILYLVTIGVFCGASALASILLSPDFFAQEFSFTLGLPLVCLAAAAVYAFSWRLAVRFYRKRDL